jgi:hypothetical protein
MLTFSLTDYHIITQSSGFGRVGAWLSGRWGNIFELAPGAWVSSKMEGTLLDCRLHCVSSVENREVYRYFVVPS